MLREPGRRPRPVGHAGGEQVGERAAVVGVDPWDAADPLVLVETGVVIGRCVGQDDLRASFRCVNCIGRYYLIRAMVVLCLRSEGVLLGQATSPESPRTAGGTPRATDRPGDESPFALGLLLRRAHERAAHALAEALRPLGLELRHFAVMIELHQRGPMNQRDLGYAVGMDKAMIVRVVDDLEKAELAVRKPIPGDRRIREVEITERGIEVFDKAHDNGRPIAEAITTQLGPAEQEQLTDLLTRFTCPAPE